MKSLQSKAGHVRIAWNKIIWFYVLMIACLFIDYGKITIHDITLVLALTTVSVGFGHSVGLHRGIIHKSYETSAWFRKLCLYLHMLTGLGSPLNWLKQHYFRDYWQNRTDCPKYYRYQHSLWTDYWWNLHLTFIPTDIETYNIPEVDLQDKTIHWLHKTWWLHYLLFALVLYLWFGLNTMLLATCLRTSIITLGHWYIGYASHKYGYARHHILNADESGYNDILLGLVSFGEGFHNNHHAYPTSARFSSKWYEIDLGWCLVWFLKKVQLITSVKTQRHNLKPTARAHGKTQWKFPWSKRKGDITPKYFNPRADSLSP